MIQARHELLQALAAALGDIAPGAPPVAAFESPRQASHGDLAITAAMGLARTLKRNPRELAAALLERLQREAAVQRWVQSADIAGPGFINLTLLPAAKQAVVAEVLAAGDRYGHKPPSGERVMVEFVSANPTGPLHVGHGRNAALGDSICNLLETQGASVLREFYYNDAGVQIRTLALSVQARLRGLKPGDAGWPEAAYNGDYIADIALGYAGRQSVSADDRSVTASGDADDLDAIAAFAVAWLRHEQDLDLRAFGVRFDHYFLESSLYRDGRVAATVQRLIASGRTDEHDGALWLHTTDYGDDKDRVMRKSDGTFTYFVPDVAYHLAKFERGYARVINVQGSDHHGTVARVRAGLQAANVGIPPGYPDYVLYKMVTVMRGGQEVKLGKRAGGYVTLRDLIDWTSRDAVRFFLASRKADTEFTFDIDLALKAGDENPVFYVQYAHARICSVIDKAGAAPGFDKAGPAPGFDKAGPAPGGDNGSAPASDNTDAANAPATFDAALLTAPSESALLLKLADHPLLLERAAAGFAPHDVAFHLRELAASFHAYYGAERFLVDDAALQSARLALLAATAQVLRNGLALLGVSAPRTMQRDAETPA